MNQTDYVLGHSKPEIERLIAQSALLHSTTLRLLHETGLKSGMRVLDIGCGAGDVSMLAAKIVGKTGTVVGIDRSIDAINYASNRGDHLLRFPFIFTKRRSSPNWTLDSST